MLIFFSLSILILIVVHVYVSDLHDQRVKQLRKLLKDIEEDDWQYEPVEKLIGLRWSALDSFLSIKELPF